MMSASKHTVLLLHGGPSFYGYMGSLGELIDPEYHVVEYAQRGTQENPTHQAITLDDHLQDLQNHINQHAQGHYTLIGHSWGANLALLFAARRPPRLSRVILIGTAPLGQSIEELFAQEMSARMDPDTARQLEILDAQLQDELNQPHSTTIDELFTRRVALIESLYHYNPETSMLMPPCSFRFKSFLESKAGLWDLITKGRLPQMLNDVQVPVFAMHGEGDVIPAHETLAFLSEHLNDCRLRLIKETGHFPWLEPQSKRECMEYLHQALK